MNKLIRNIFLLLLFVASINTFATTYTVTNTNDYAAGGTAIPGSLRLAITSANANAGPDIILFSISGPGPHTINLINSLPLIQEELNIQGPPLQGGYPQVIIDGQGTVFVGINVLSTGSKSNFSNLGFENFRYSAFRLRTANEVTIKNNVIINIDMYDIRLEASSDVLIQDNFIGTDPSLSNYGNNSIVGVYLISDPGNSNVSNSNQIINNTIAHQNSFGIQMNTFGGNPLMNRYNLFKQNHIFNHNYNAIALANNNDNKKRPSITSISPTGFIEGETYEIGDRIEIFGSTGSENANQYITTVTAVAGLFGPVWSANLGAIPWSHITATATDFPNKNSPEPENTSALSYAFPVPPPCPTPNIVATGECTSAPVVFDLNPSTNLSGATITWDFGDGTTVTSNVLPQSHNYTSSNTYTVSVTVLGPNPCSYTTTKVITVECCECLSSFAPLPGGKYVLSAWVKETQPFVIGTQVEQQVETYTGPEIYLEFTDAGGVSLPTAGPYTGSKKIIDGWQQIEQVFVIPIDALKMKIKLNNGGFNDVYFDDVRIHPFNSSMKSYVYDPESLRLWSELDENNYATFYEYDEQGNLTRIKKETDRGIVTIQESREGQYKKEKDF